MAVGLSLAAKIKTSDLIGTQLRQKQKSFSSASAINLVQMMLG